jgi:hypothetical protein
MLPARPPWCTDVTGLWTLDDKGSNLGRGTVIFCTPQRPDRLWRWGGTSLISNGFRGPFRGGVKRLGRKADHAPPTSAEVKNGGAVPPVLHTSSRHDASLIKQRGDRFTFYIPSLEVNMYLYAPDSHITNWYSSTNIIRMIKSRRVSGQGM